MSWLKRYAEWANQPAMNQPALNTLETSNTASPADKPIMASRPFQISA
jgi:hypothetical protein